MAPYQGAMVKDLETYVNINTGTLNHECLHQFSVLRLKEFEAIGFETTHPPDFPELPKSEVWISLHRLAKATHSVTDQVMAEAMGLSAVIGEPIVGIYLSG